MQSLGSQSRLTASRRAGAGHEHQPDLDADLCWPFQVPLPSSVFVNTTESYEVERSVRSPSFPKALFLQTRGTLSPPWPLVSLFFCAPHSPWCWAVAGTSTQLSAWRNRGTADAVGSVPCQHHPGHGPELCTRWLSRHPLPLASELQDREDRSHSGEWGSEGP